MKNIVILPFFLMTTIYCYAQKVSVEGIRYKIDALTKTASVTDSLDQAPDGEPAGLYEGVIKIPKTFKYNGEKYKVTSIGKHAFWNCEITEVDIPSTVLCIEEDAFLNCSGLTSLDLPKSVTNIGDEAFIHCDDLTTITIPKSVTSIGKGAFQGCSNLSSLTLSNSVTSIGEDAFYQCSNLTSINIPKSVTSIGSGAFLETGITSLVVDEDNLNYCAVDNVLYTKDKTQLLFCPSGKEGAFVIPNSVTRVGEYAFNGCTGLTSLTTPNSVTSIGGYAFAGCAGLTSLRISSSLTEISEYAFSGCSGLTSVTIPSSVSIIGDDAFYICSSLSSVTIPQSVTSIGTFAFNGCEGLTSIRIPSSVTNIGEDAFIDCPKLTSVVIDADGLMAQNYEEESNMSSIFGEQVKEYIIGDDVKMIGKYAFHDCRNLESVTIGNSVKIIDEGAFSDCRNLTDITISNSVIRIGDYAFSGCRSIYSVDLPNSLTLIGDYTFAGCKSLYSVKVPSSVTHIGKLAFPHHIQKNAQPEINRKFFGLTLGVTTKQQAISKLLEQQADIALNTKKVLHLRKVSHDGFNFGSAQLHFYNDILSQIDFLEANADEESQQMSQSKYEQIKDYYDKKHGSYKYFLLEETGDIYNDDATTLIINQKGIIFSDENMKEQRSKAEAARNREIHPLPEAEPRIDKTVLGCTLGISTRQQVKDALEAQNIKVVSDCSPDSIVFSAITHEGVKFSRLTAVFFAGRLMTMKFTNSGKGLSRSDYSALKASIGTKYSAYDMNYYHDNNTFDDLTSYTDDIMGIAISQKGILGISDGGLIYQDKELGTKNGDYEYRSLRGEKTVTPDNKYIVDLFKNMDGLLNGLMR